MILHNYVDGGCISSFCFTCKYIMLQVLPMRTHPQIGMSGGGGYLLTVTTITKPA
jgi:hypothetical protein